MRSRICSRTGNTIHYWDAPLSQRPGSTIRNAVTVCRKVVKQAVVVSSTEHRNGDYILCERCGVQ
jgi:hypothetical protein